MSEELKTIKELADELGVSKQAIQYHIKSLTNKNRQTNDKGVTVLSAIEQEFIRGKVDKQTNKNKTNEPTKKRQTDKQKEPNINQYLLNEIEEVKKNRDKQLAVKDKQIENKDIQIAQMQNLLDQQQRLALQDKKLLEEYKAENDSLKALKMPSEDAKEEQSSNRPKTELDSLKSEITALNDKIKGQEQANNQSSKKWYQFWK
ncbi:MULTISPECIES: HTH domain-containing protein [Lactococcus]|uniref:HTH domain-containing protein n=1 Tax=Lactococcus TaxID=1357 RepID=UPI0010658E4D|nr:MULTISPECIES: HTH domain-containing protein [Lactococcus]MCT0060909.1 HTH domain-containing protein [Lactococcus lactis subsp. lactis]MCT0137774.1 HTH domain-containing protein [Lactococcus lactis subsp. lactis]TEA95228.1 DNA-binding protein [Lactococcus cremoris]WMB98649.1 HTH domain-containing protein [Lactococcus cremoris]